MPGASSPAASACSSSSPSAAPASAGWCGTGAGSGHSTRRAAAGSRSWASPAWSEWSRAGARRARSAQAELGDDRQVVARHARDLQPAGAGAGELQGAAEVDAVEPPLGRERRVGAQGAVAAGLAVGGALEAQAVGEARAQQRAPAVEVPPHQGRHLRREIPELGARGQELHLPDPLAGGEPEVEVEDLQVAALALPALSVLAVEQQRGVLAAAADPAPADALV